MKFAQYDGSSDACSQCSNTDEVYVDTVVFASALHRGGTRKLKHGGVVGQLRVQCAECGYTIWATGDLTLPEQTRAGWERDSPCTNCGQTHILEYHLDTHVETFDGTHRYELDRTNTLLYNCAGCGTVLHSNTPEWVSENHTAEESRDTQLSLDVWG